MTLYRKDAAIIGSLFLAVMVFWFLGYWLIAGVLHTPEYLVHLDAQKGRLFAGSFFELLEIGAVLGIMAMVFPLMRLYSEAGALWYVFLRLLECVLLLAGAAVPLVLLTVGQQSTNLNGAGTGMPEQIGTLFMAIREKWVFQLIPYFYGLSGIVFFRFLMTSRLVPKAFGVVGIIGCILVLATVPMDFFGFKQGASLGAVMGLVEIVLGGWLLIKGFETTTDKCIITYYQRSW